MASRRPYIQTLCKEYKDKLPHGFKCNAKTEVLKDALKGARIDIDQEAETRGWWKAPKQPTKAKQKKSILKTTYTYEGSVWAVITSSAKYPEPGILHVVFFSGPEGKNVSELDATSVLGKWLWEEELYSSGLYKMPKKVPGPKEILKFLEKINDKDASYHIVKIY